jgi:hypothetical protein
MYAPKPPRKPVRRLKPSMAPVAVLVVAALLLSGCTGGRATTQDASQLRGGSLTATSEEVLQDGLGAINGTVVNENGAALRGVHVVLLGTSNFATTDRHGRFYIGNIGPGTYTLRADASGYLSLESMVDVVADVVKKVTVTLFANDNRGVGYREHLHDYWGDQTVLTLFDERVRMPPKPTPCGKFVAVGLNSGDACYLAPFYLPGEKIVYPGTRELELTINWEKRDVVKQIQLRYAHAAKASLQAGPVLGPGETARIPVAEGEGDHGHQRFSLWAFNLYVFPDYGAPTAPNYLVMSWDETNDRFVGDFHVTLRAHKGIVPSEPPHAFHWDSAPRIVLLEKAEKKITTIGGATRNPKQVSCDTVQWCYTLPKDVTVPPGTTRLEVTLEYDPALAALKPHTEKKTLAFRPANVNPRTADWEQFRADAPQSNDGSKAVWNLPIKPEESDAFYQHKSLWAFYPAIAGEEKADKYDTECPSSCGGDLFYLTVIAVNDNWEADKEAGRI